MIHKSMKVIIPAMPSPARTKDPVSGKLKPDHNKPKINKIVGYYTKGSTPNFARLAEYQSWKQHVVSHFPKNFTTIPESLTSQLERSANSPDSAVMLTVKCWFANGVHPDVENVRKSIVDSVFPGGDKWVSGYVPLPMYDAENPRVEVYLNWKEDSAVTTGPGLMVSRAKSKLKLSKKNKMK
jgi:hypothetical protein